MTSGRKRYPTSGRSIEVIARHPVSSHATQRGLPAAAGPRRGSVAVGTEDGARDHRTGAEPTADTTPAAHAKGHAADPDQAGKVAPYCAEGKGYKQALPALARRRVNVLWAMIRDGACYQATPPVTAAA